MRKLLNMLVLALIIFSGSSIAIANENSSLNDLLSKPVEEINKDDLYYFSTLLWPKIK